MKSAPILLYLLKAVELAVIGTAYPRAELHRLVRKVYQFCLIYSNGASGYWHSQAAGQWEYWKSLLPVKAVCPLVM